MKCSGILLLFFQLLFSGFLHAQQGKLIIRGLAIDTTGKGLREVHFEVYRSDSVLVVDTISDTRGTYRFDLPYNEVYYVLVTKLGYKDKAFQVKSSGLYGNELLKNSVVNNVKIELHKGNSEPFAEPTGIVAINYRKRLFEAKMIEHQELSKR